MFSRISGSLTATPYRFATCLFNIMNLMTNFFFLKKLNRVEKDRELGGFILLWVIRGWNRIEY